MLEQTKRISFIISSFYLRWSRSRTFTPALAPTKKYGTGSGSATLSPTPLKKKKNPAHAPVGTGTGQLPML